MHYILPEHRQLCPGHLHSLFETDLSNPRHNSRRTKDIGITDIDIGLAGCLVDHFCVYWFYSSNLLGRTLEHFLNENISEIYDLVDTGHFKSRGITIDEWVLLFGSDTNVFRDKDIINHVSAKSNIMMQHLYEANVLMPRILLNNLC